MGRRNWTTQLVVAEKLVNGLPVGFQVGFAQGDHFCQSIRRNVVYKTEAEAVAVLESLEANTHPRRASHRITQRGSCRFDSGDATDRRYSRDYPDRW